MPIKLQDCGVLLHAEPEKVLLRPFDLSWDETDAAASRPERLIDHVLQLPKESAARELDQIYSDFSERHEQVRIIFRARCMAVLEQAGLSNDDIDSFRQELLGAYFCQEYSYASAAIMNPSVTLHPDQSDIGTGRYRVIISTRTVGEGHISSIAFRVGVVSEDGGFELEPDPSISTAATVIGSEMDDRPGSVRIVRSPSTSLSEMVLFPVTAAQAGGLEDLRLTKMPINGSSQFHWVGTYTAYSGRDIQSELLLTGDFKTFDMVPLRGDAARNKGMALFPRKIGNKYAMIGRQDGENLFYIESPDLFEWSGGTCLMSPRYPWEFVQIGNCGPPIELDEGWLVLTHGVGAMRKYSIGAMLLDKDDPSVVLSRTPKPILSAAGEHRNGYVPNVVYSCGAMRCGSKLFLPYAIADSSIAFAFVDLKELIGSMEPE